MADWIEHPITLDGQLVQLFTLNKYHFSELESLAKDKRIWQHYVYDGSDDNRLRAVLKTALTDMLNGIP